MKIALHRVYGRKSDCSMTRVLDKTISVVSVNG